MKFLHPLLEILSHLKIITLGGFIFISSIDLFSVTCPANWTPFNANGGCYKYFAKEYSWEEARDACLSEQVSHIDTFKLNPGIVSCTI